MTDGLELVPEPDQRRFPLIGHVPVEMNVDGRQFRRGRHDGDPGVFRQQAGVGFRHGQQQVGFLDDPTGGEIVLAAQPDVTVYSEP